jgi:hypothetical protein
MCEQLKIDHKQELDKLHKNYEATEEKFVKMKMEYFQMKE